MIFQEQDGQTIILDKSSLLVNGVAYELPKRLQNRSGHSLVQVNQKIYIDGYEFQNGKFRRSLAAFFHMLF
jgi:hypothetical protein